jgi:hypothetical protein
MYGSNKHQCFCQFDARLFGVVPCRAKKHSRFLIDPNVIPKKTGCIDVNVVAFLGGAPRYFSDVIPDNIDFSGFFFLKNEVLFVYCELPFVD